MCVDVMVFKKCISNANFLDISVGTNCPKGGDAGFGGRTVLRLKNSTSLLVRVDEGNQLEVNEIELIVKGDTECLTMIEALEFAVLTLKNQCSGVQVTTEIIN